MDDLLVPDTILLCCERVRYRRDCVDLGIRAEHGVQASSPNVQVHVLEP
jgi:hypothetical protein